MAAEYGRATPGSARPLVIQCVRNGAFLALIVCLALVPGLAGCTLIEDDPDPESESRLKVSHAAGETVVPAHADRVVALVPDAAETSRALGARIVGTEPDPGAIFAVSPEVIFGSQRSHRRLYDRLEEIAPTVFEEGPGVDWKLNLRLHGESLNQPDRGERLLRDYDRRVAATRRRLGPRTHRTEVSVVRVAPDGVHRYAQGSFAGTLLGDVGLARPAPQSGRQERTLVTPDQIPTLDGDVLLLGVAPGGDANLRRLMADPAWSRLRAVRNGRVLRVEDHPWFVGQGILSARRALRELARLPVG